MSLSNLKDDLIQEFREEREMINSQIDILDPLATTLRKPAAQRILSSGALVICEIFGYLAFLGAIAFIIFMNKLYPFSVLSDVFYNSQYRNQIGIVNLTYLNWGIYGICALAGILFYFLARTCRSVRLKNEILNMAGKDIKIIVGQHLHRQARIHAIEQRHLIDMPGTLEIMKVNKVPNPGYSDEHSL